MVNDISSKKSDNIMNILIWSPCNNLQVLSAIAQLVGLGEMLDSGH